MICLNSSLKFTLTRQLFYNTYFFTVVIAGWWESWLDRSPDASGNTLRCPSINWNTTASFFPHARSLILQSICRRLRRISRRRRTCVRCALLHCSGSLILRRKNLTILSELSNVCTWSSNISCIFFALASPTKVASSSPRTGGSVKLLSWKLVSVR